MSETAFTPPRRQCHGCRYLSEFKARPDEQARYGFGETGYGCNEHGFEGYVDPNRPICVRGPYAALTKATGHD